MVRCSWSDGYGNKAVLQLIDFKNWLENNKDAIDVLVNDSEKTIFSDIKAEGLDDIEIINIKNFIPSKLISKFIKFKITYIGKLKEYTYEEFKSLPGVGQNTVSILKNWILDINTDPDKYLSLHNRLTKGIILPKNYIPSPDRNQIDLCKSIIDDFLNLENLYGSKRAVKFLDLYYGLNQDEPISQLTIGTLNDLTHERVRQIIVGLEKRIKNVFKGQTDNKLNARISSHHFDLVKNFSSYLKEVKLITESKLINDIIGPGISKYSDIGYVKFILKIMNLHQVPSTVSHFVEDLYYYDKRLPIDQIFSAAKSLMNEMNDKAIPVSYEYIVNFLKRKYRKISKQEINLILVSFPDIENLSHELNESFENQTYQLKFDKLSRVGLMGYRVLWERKRATAIDDLLAEVQRRLFLNDVYKRYKRETFQHSILEVEDVIPKGKTGIYTLSSWGDNSDSITDLINFVLLDASHPLTQKQIINRIRKIRPRLTEKSIRAIISMDYLVLKNGKCIHPNWRTTYLDKLKSKSDLSTSEIAAKIVETRGGEIERFELLNLLAEMPEFTRDLAHSTINRKYLFEDFQESGIKKLRLIEGWNVKKKDTRNEEFVKNAKKYFYDRRIRNCKLKEFVSKFTSKYYKKHTLYKKINQNDTIFKKYIENDEVMLTLVEFISFEPDTIWMKTKTELMFDIQEVFNDPRQKKYSQTVENGLALFKKIVDYATSDVKLNALNESLIPMIHTYFHESNSKSDLVAILKEVAISLDAFYKKILFVVNPQQYQNIILNKKGFGAVIDSLPKIDARRNRYKSSARSASLFDFGQHIWIAYSSRNDKAHNATKLSIREINLQIHSCLVVYIYGVMEYYDELNTYL